MLRFWVDYFCWVGLQKKNATQIVAFLKPADFSTSKLSAKLSARKTHNWVSYSFGRALEQANGIYRNRLTKRILWNLFIMILKLFEIIMIVWYEKYIFPQNQFFVNKIKLSLVGLFGWGQRKSVDTRYLFVWVKLVLLKNVLLSKNSKLKFLYYTKILLDRKEFLIKIL